MFVCRVGSLAEQEPSPRTNSIRGTCGIVQASQLGSRPPGCRTWRPDGLAASQAERDQLLQFLPGTGYDTEPVSGSNMRQFLLAGILAAPSKEPFDRKTLR